MGGTAKGRKVMWREIDLAIRKLNTKISGCHSFRSISTYSHAINLIVIQNYFPGQT